MTRGPRVVALGGGHGLAASLAALRTLTAELAAVVSVGDDGGSSGRLRNELGVLPPGDFRMALVALCCDDESTTTLASVCQHRFGGRGDLAGHAVGNLLLAGLLEQVTDPVRALVMAGRLLGLDPGTRVLPMCPEPVDSVGTVRERGGGQRLVFGQHALGAVHGELVSVALRPHAPPATPQVLAALEQADLVVFGPGSLFTSVLPHLLVPDLHKALLACRGRRVLVQNLTPQPGETAGFSPARHLVELHRQAGDLSLDVVLADRSCVDAGGELAAAARRFGGELVVADLADPAHPDVHHPSRLARVLAECLR